MTWLRQLQYVFHKKVPVCVCVCVWGGGGSGAVRRERFLVRGLKGCYWWKKYDAPGSYATTYRLKTSIS
jgi:hypothetical protein